MASVPKSKEDTGEQRVSPPNDSVANEETTLTTKDSYAAAPAKEATIVEEGIIPPKPSQGDSWRVASSSDANGLSKRRPFVVILVLLVITVAVVVTVVVTQGNDNDEGSNRASPALFQNPSKVIWKRQVRIEDPKIDNSRNFAVEFGMSADGTRLVIGDFPVGAHVYHLNNGTWQKHGFLKDENALELGERVAMAPGGDTIVVLGKDQNERLRPNVVYIYAYKAENDQWEKQGQVIGEFIDGEGIGPLDMSENGMLAVASPQHGGKQGSRQGMIRFFERTQTGPWQFQGRVEGKGPGDYVGDTVRLSADGSTVVSSNMLMSTENGFSSGIVWVWRRDEETDEWLPLGAPILGSRTNARLGAGHVAINQNGNTIAAMPHDPWGNKTPGVLVYDFVPAASLPGGGSWQVRGGEALAMLPSPGYRLENGFCLSADGSVLVLGSTQKAIVQQYDATRQTWVQVGEFASDDKADFGPEVACAPNVRTIALGVTTLKGKSDGGTEAIEGKVTVWTAVGSSENE